MNEYNIHVYDGDDNKKYVLLDDLGVVIKAGQKLHERISKAIKILNQYEEDYVEEPSMMINKKDRKEQWTIEEYQETLEQILRGKDNE